MPDASWCCGAVVCDLESGTSFKIFPDLLGLLIIEAFEFFVKVTIGIVDVVDIGIVVVSGAASISDELFFVVEMRDDSIDGIVCRDMRSVLELIDWCGLFSDERAGSRAARMHCMLVFLSRASGCVRLERIHLSLICAFGSIYEIDQSCIFFPVFLL